MEQDHDRSPPALKEELSEQELEKVFGGGTLVGNPGKVEQAFHDLLISNY